MTMTTIAVGGGGAAAAAAAAAALLPHSLYSNKSRPPPATLPVKNQNPSPNPKTLDSGLLFRRKILYLEERLRVDSSKALAKNPDIRSAPLASLQAVEDCLCSFGIERPEMGRIFGMHPQLLTCSPDSDLYPVFHFLLDDAAIPFPDLRRSVSRCPRLLVSSVPRQLRPTLYFLRRLGFVPPHHAITCQTSLLLVSSVEGTLLPKLDYLRSLGLSHREVVNMVLRSPGLLTFSIQNNFRPKVDYLFDHIGGDLSDLKRFPQYFSFSLEGRIKPRHRLLLQHGFSLPLSDMLKVSDGEFSDRLVEMLLHTLDRTPLL